MKDHAQAGASKLGNAMNAMDNGLMNIGAFRLRRTGFKLGMFPSSVSSKGIPFRTMVWLLRYPSFGVRWYSSLNNCSSALLPIHDADFLRPRMKALPLYMVVFFTNKLRFMLFSTLIWNVVWLLKLIRSKVMPACNDTMAMVKKL